MNIGNIFLDFKVIEKTPCQRVYRYQELKDSYLYKIQCIHCQFTKTGHSGMFLKTLKCSHCYTSRNSKDNHIKKDNWIIYLESTKSEISRVRGKSPNFKWLCTTCNHFILKSTCNPKPSTIFKCPYCNRNESKFEFANNRVKNNQARLRRKPTDTTQSPHEKMNHQELLDKCISICPEIEIINLSTEIHATKIYSRMKNCLYNHGIFNIKQLLDMNEIDFYRIKNMGRKTAQDALIVQRYLIIKLKNDLDGLE